MFASMFTNETKPARFTIRESERKVFIKWFMKSCTLSVVPCPSGGYWIEFKSSTPEVREGNGRVREAWGRDRGETEGSCVCNLDWMPSVVKVMRDVHQLLAKQGRRGPPTQNEAFDYLVGILRKWSLSDPKAADNFNRINVSSVVMQSMLHGFAGLYRGVGSNVNAAFHSSAANVAGGLHNSQKERVMMEHLSQVDGIEAIEAIATLMFFSVVGDEESESSDEESDRTGESSGDDEWEDEEMTKEEAKAFRVAKHHPVKAIPAEKDKAIPHIAKHQVIPAEKSTQELVTGQKDEEIPHVWVRVVPTEAEATCITTQRAVKVIPTENSIQGLVMGLKAAKPNVFGNVDPDEIRVFVHAPLELLQEGVPHYSEELRSTAPLRFPDDEVHAYQVLKP
eukprot:PhF_6_TR42401/c0_g1_i1/m.63963